MKQLSQNAVPTAVRPFLYFIAGGCGGIANALTGHPLDTVKTHLQTMPVRTPPVYTGTYDCFKKIFLQDGVRGLYSGVTVNLFILAPMCAISFSTYGLGKSIQEVAGGYNSSQLTGINFFIAGAFSGIFISLLNAPGERVKLIIQVNNAERSQPPFTYQKKCEPKKDKATKILFQLYKKGGIRRVYKGLLLTLVREVPSCGAYFTTYELLKSLMMTELPLSPYKTVIAGGTAGIAYWLVALPSDNVKSRFQSAPEKKYRGSMDVFREIHNEKGIFGLYRGLTSVAIRAFPSQAACFVTFEYSKNTLLYYFK